MATCTRQLPQEAEVTGLKPLPHCIPGLVSCGRRMTPKPFPESNPQARVLEQNKHILVWFWFSLENTLVFVFYSGLIIKKKLFSSFLLLTSLGFFFFFLKKVGCHSSAIWLAQLSYNHLKDFHDNGLKILSNLRAEKEQSYRIAFFLCPGRTKLNGSHKPTWFLRQEVQNSSIANPGQHLVVRDKFIALLLSPQLEPKRLCFAKGWRWEWWW